MQYNNNANLKLPIFINYFRCRYCKDKWRVYRKEPQYNSYCHYCYYKVRIKNCRKINDQNSNLKCFGSFCCRKCNKEWTSKNSWILYNQKCYSCNNKNKPYDLKDLDRIPRQIKGKKSKDLMHKMENCSKCIELGYNCVDYYGEDDSEYFDNYYDDYSYDNYYDYSYDNY